MATLETLHQWVDEEYKKAHGKPYVMDTTAYAAYKVWRRADAAYRKERAERAKES